MKKLFFLALASLMIMITSCSSKKVVATTTTTTSNCPWQMGQMTEKTIQNFQLSAERLEGSKVSIDRDIKLELPTEHKVDSAGRHNFYQKGIFLPAGSVGVIHSTSIDNEAVVKAPKKIYVTFSEKTNGNHTSGTVVNDPLVNELFKTLDQDSLKVSTQKVSRLLTFCFELENSKEISNVVLLMKKDVSPEVYRSLSSKGIVADGQGYLRNGNSYYQMVGGKPVLYNPTTSQGLGKYRLSFVKVQDPELKKFNTSIPSSSNGYAKVGSDYLIFDSVHSEFYLNSGATVYLDQIKFRVCSQLESIKTEGFDEKK